MTPLQKDEYFVEDLKENKVFYETEYLGKVKSILDIGEIQVLEIDNDKKKYYLPFLKEYLKEIDNQNKHIFLTKKENFF